MGACWGRSRPQAWLCQGGLASIASVMLLPGFPPSCAICSGTNTMPFLPSHHFPLISTSASNAQTPHSLVRPPLLPVCFLLSWVSLFPSHQTSHLWIREIISAILLRELLLCSLWQWLFPYLSGSQNSFCERCFTFPVCIALVIVFYSNFFLNHDSPQTI